jgi:magnesium chelatase family protein
MLVKTYTVAVNGLETTTITIEVNITKGVPFYITGLPASTV